MLELLAAVCLVRGGHDIILAAFDNFKEVLRPPHPQRVLALWRPLESCGWQLWPLLGAAGSAGWAFGEHRVGISWNG